MIQLSRWDLQDICENNHGGDQFSAEANDSVLSIKAIQRQQIKSHIAAQPNGATCEEIGLALGMRYTSCSARISELRAAGELTSSGRRPTSTGRSARVHFVI